MHFVCLFVQKYGLLWFLPAAGFALFMYHMFSILAFPSLYSLPCMFIFDFVFYYCRATCHYHMAALQILERVGSL